MVALRIEVSGGEIVFTEPCPFGKHTNVGSACCACCKYCDHTDYAKERVYCVADEEQQDEQEW